MEKIKPLLESIPVETIITYIGCKELHKNEKYIVYLSKNSYYVVFLENSKKKILDCTTHKEISKIALLIKKGIEVSFSQAESLLKIKSEEIQLTVESSGAEAIKFFYGAYKLNERPEFLGNDIYFSLGEEKNKLAYNPTNESICIPLYNNGKIINYIETNENLQQLRYEEIQGGTYLNAKNKSCKTLYISKSAHAYLNYLFVLKNEDNAFCLIAPNSDPESIIAEIKRCGITTENINIMIWGKEKTLEDMIYFTKIILSIFNQTLPGLILHSIANGFLDIAINTNNDYFSKEKYFQLLENYSNDALGNTLSEDYLPISSNYETTEGLFYTLTIPLNTVTLEATARMLQKYISTDYDIIISHSTNNPFKRVDSIVF